MTYASALAKTLARRRAEQSMGALITLLRGGVGVLDEETGEVGGLSNARTIYHGKARIRTVNGGSKLTGAGGEIAMRDTVISLPIGAPVPFVNDVVQIEDADDVELDVTTLSVVGVDGGGLLGDARRMTCSGWAPNRQWGEQ